VIAGWMRYSRRCGISLAACLLASLILGTALFAQTPPLAEKLPQNTVCYIEWRGMALLSAAEKENHVLQLLEDPDFAPVWAAFASNFRQPNRGQSTSASAIAPPVLLSLLDNPVAFGLVETPGTSKSSPAGSIKRPVGFFLVYDATGKTGLIEKWSVSRQTHTPAATEVTHYDVGGTSVEVRTRGKNVSYIARAANYYLLSDQEQTIEDLLTRFRGAGHSAPSLEQLPEYQEARKFFGADNAIEFFARMPDLSRWTPANPKDRTGVELAKNLHLEKIHVVEGGVSFAGEATRFRGAILGDTSPGGPLDLAAPSSAGFRIQEVASGGSAFTLSRLNLAATYAFVRTALFASLPPQQTANFTAFENAAQSFLGMPIADVLGLFTGEAASVSSYSIDGRPQRLFAATIQQPEALLRALRAVIGPMIASEGHSGSTTYLDISYPYRDSKTGMQRRRFYYVAVTPQMILVAPRKAMLRQVVTQLGSQTDAAHASGIFANAEYAQMRSRLPEKLSGLSGADITQIPWDRLLANLEDQADQVATRSKRTHPPDLTWLKLLKPKVITRHLHMTVGGWWKDSNGVYFDSYLQ
jgi:hypothetical protein